MAERVLGGRYQVLDKVGTGGMATVYRGMDQVLGRTVAIKTMLPQYATDPSFAARFKQEAQAAAALNSPYIVSVYDWGKDGDTYYIIMEYLRGTDLKSGIRKHGALDCKKVAQIGSQIAQALSVAHNHDIIHRDIKPQNIMVQPDGNIKVMDFGIARAKNSHLTTDNSVLGTAHYVSPEQTQGKPLGPTTDLYSLGIVMYEAATGRVPFDGDNAVTVAMKQVTEQPVPPSQINPNVDPQLEAVILKCMQKDPKDRFQTADELYHTLHDYLAGRMQAVNNATAMLPAAATTPLAGRSGNATQSMPRMQATGRIRPQSATEQAAQEEEERQKKHKRNRVLAVLGAIAGIALVVFLVVSVLGSGSKAYSVPNLLGLTQDEATSMLESDGHGFEIGQVTEQYSSTVDEGKIIEQTPGAGRTATEGSKIDIVVSKGEEPAASVTVPDLTNCTPSEAQDLLNKYGLKGQAGDSVYNADVEVGHVAEQEPAAGTSAKAGDTITYHLSQGAEQVSVPNVVGDTQADATSALKNEGFSVNVVQSSSSSVDKGHVISSNPSAGTSADKGSTVTITVSTGPASVSVPNVVGYDESSAEAALKNAGFDVSVTTEQSSTVAKGKVIKQSATSATSGSTITIVVSSGPGSNSTNNSNGNSTSNEGNTSNQSHSSGNGTSNDH
ncbi:MAG: Stk1 family PASTA domain-containing Ser/Thr kinase [Olsenella sp.]|jgi:serine/threonine-protein kinase|nr:Stk1 family PASTA domain-containing Ser/Thr kinase [Olsenella sp.]MCI1880460.1 Stk1 family PASTA domain-containing Ser/Thr kinase [Olsenella sp.]MCI2160239.1 Stk1 family PASTA domain-containing Ser/Thr kinase [Olsenella sp.]MCI2188235.1 Stk1 family PASTA domain-containing Ser/Thr kinase [Olsenella sp.]